MQEGKKCILMIFQDKRFSVSNMMFIGNNLNLILNNWEDIGSYLKPLTMC